MSELSTPYFYYVEDEYINFLKKKEIEKRNFTRVPNVHYWNTKKFVFGAVLEINNMLYFAPVTSYAKYNILFISSTAPKTNFLVFQ